MKLSKAHSFLYSVALMIYDPIRETQWEKAATRRRVINKFYLLFIRNSLLQKCYWWCPLCARNRSNSNRLGENCKESKFNEIPFFATTKINICIWRLLTTTVHTHIHTYNRTLLLKCLFLLKILKTTVHHTYTFILYSNIFFV